MSRRTVLMKSLVVALLCIAPLPGGAVGEAGEFSVQLRVMSLPREAVAKLAAEPGVHFTTEIAPRIERKGEGIAGPDGYAQYAVTATGFAGERWDALRQFEQEQRRAGETLPDAGSALLPSPVKDALMRLGATVMTAPRAMAGDGQDINMVIGSSVEFVSGSDDEGEPVTELAFDGLSVRARASTFQKGRTSLSLRIVEQNVTELLEVGAPNAATQFPVFMTSTFEHEAVVENGAYTLFVSNSPLLGHDGRSGLLAVLARVDSLDQ